MKHKAKLSISRPTYGDGREMICIRIKDTDARIEFVELEIGYAEFTQALTGLSEVSCSMDVRGLQNVGKQLEREQLTFKMPEDKPFDKNMAAQLAILHAPDGWEPSTYFGSKSSFFSKDGANYATTDISRWVEKEE